MTEPRVLLADQALYFGDNGRIFCGRHAGATARYTSRDLDGQPVELITAEVAAAFRREVGFAPACETCRAIEQRGGAR